MTNIKKNKTNQELAANKETKGNSNNNLNHLYNKLSSHIDNARRTIQRSIDTEMVKAYWLIGRDIVEEEQRGRTRADYASYIIEELSTRLNKQYGKGFSFTTLRDARQFYLTHKPIHHAVSGESQKTFSPSLGWIHYRALMRVSRFEARKFYEIEAIKNNWSGRELERQIGSLLFDRLAKSKNKEQFLKLACKGHEVSKPEDTIKEPLVLEFLNIPESHKLVESKLEQALINNLQHFMMELGKGFAFVGRQKRITFDSNHYYCDLVFYNYILKCFVIIDIKTKTLSHADLGQIQLYVNYFDKEIKMENDNPTIGLILCTEKSNKMVEYFLGDKAKQIFASTYQFHLPTEAELEAELKKEIKNFKEDIEFNQDFESNQSKSDTNPKQP
jgi:predicted nuclease of restriction endonuclease-like (RecB) superfamily